MAETSGIITRQAIRRGTFRSVKDLTAASGTFIDGYNDRCTPFAWTKDADELLTKIRHVEVFRLGGVRTPIIGRPRPSPRHRHAHSYTLECEDPAKLGVRLRRAFANLSDRAIQ